VSASLQPKIIELQNRTHKKLKKKKSFGGTVQFEASIAAKDGAMPISAQKTL